MELIYLWTKSYKNLKNGYILSSEYNIKHDIQFSSSHKIKLTKNKKIKNFFDKKDNICVNAIIGENGSGKSSILKLIINLLYINETDNNDNKIDSSFLIVKIENEFVYISSDSFIEIYLLDNRKNLYLKKYDKKFYTIYFNYMLDSLQDHSREVWIDNIYHKSDDYTMPILLEPYKKGNVVNINNLNYLTRQRMILYKNEFKKNEFLNNIFSPKNVKITIDTDKLLNIYNSNIDGKYTPVIKEVYGSYFSPLDNIQNEIEQEERNIVSIQKRYKNNPTKAIHIEKNRRENIKKLQDEIKLVFYNNIPFHILNNLYIANKIDKYHKFKRDKNLLGGVDGFSFDKYDNRIQVRIDDNSHNTLKLRNALQYHEFILNNKDIKFIENNESLLSINDSRLNCLPSWFKVSFIDEEEKTFTSLSAGEKSFYILLTSIVYQIINIKSRHTLGYGIYSNILILLDEADLGLHPKWQRLYLSNILNTLKQIDDNLKYHIIFTSHSPFIVSDLPKENILFLDNGKSTNLNDNEYTFGENIHSLLNDSFFMQKDMMMGKFAEDKIQDCFDFFEKIFRNNKMILKLEENEKKFSHNEKYKKLQEEKNILRLNYIEKLDYFKDLSEILGENYIKNAFKNAIEECNGILNIKKNRDNKSKILDLINKYPHLVDKWLKDIE